MQEIYFAHLVTRIFDKINNCLWSRRLKTISSNMAISSNNSTELSQGVTLQANTLSRQAIHLTWKPQQGKVHRKRGKLYIDNAKTAVQFTEVEYLQASQ